MKVSELVKKLQEFKDDYGDMLILAKQCERHDTFSSTDIKYVEFEPYFYAAVVEIE